MQLFLVNLMFHIYRNDLPTSQFDEQVRIIKASSCEEALEKAHELARKEEEFEGNLCWKLIGIPDLQELNKLNTGEQIYSVTHEHDSPTLFVDYIRQKSISIRAESVFFR